jgi:hypothetical protein
MFAFEGRPPDAIFYKIRWENPIPLWMGMKGESMTK